MKKLIFTAVIIFSCFSFKIADAQVRLNLGVNIGSQPEWAPVGYDHADYYFFPDMDIYYDVNAHQFIHFGDGGQWHRSYDLPPRWRNFDIYHAYKVVINNDNSPWTRDIAYRQRYAQFRGRHDQVIIRDSHDPKYRNHWHK